jgi:hypothetical protein
LLPELFFHPLVPGPSFNAAVARQHPLDVAIQYRAMFMPGQRADRGGGGTADAGEFEYLFEPPREFAAILLDDDPRGVGCARALVSRSSVHCSSLAAGAMVGNEATKRW